MKKIFIITGEYSGDMHAANVVKELRALGSDVEIEGIGGINLEAQGVKLFAKQDKMSAVGISLKIIIDHFKLGKASSASLPKAIPIFSWSAFVFGSTATLITGSGKSILSRITGSFSEAKVSPVIVSLRPTTAPISPA